MIFIVSYLQKENIDHFLELDRAFYKKEYWVSKEATLDRINRNHCTDITVMHNNKMVGYISLCPVSQNVFTQILTNTISEEEIEGHTIPYNKVGHYLAYLSSIVIDKHSFPFFQGLYLFHYLQDHLNKLRKQGIFIDAIVAHAVSPAGHKTLQRFGFREVKPDLYICRASKSELTLISPHNHVYCVIIVSLLIICVALWRSA